MSQESRREVFAFALLGIAAFLLISLLSYSPQEDHLLGDRVANACGPVGAFAAHQLHSWVGRWGAFLLDGALALWGLVLLIGLRLRGVGWKLAGLAILVLALASIEVALTEEAEYFPGGYYGQYFYGLLLSRLSQTGSLLLLATALVVAVLVSTEEPVVPALVRAGRYTIRGGHWGLGRKALLGFSRGLGAVGALRRLRRRRTMPADGERASDGAPAAAGAPAGGAARGRMPAKSPPSASTGPAAPPAARTAPVIREPLPLPKAASNAAGRALGDDGALDRDEDDETAPGEGAGQTTTTSSGDGEGPATESASIAAQAGGDKTVDGKTVDASAPFQLKIRSSETLKPTRAAAPKNRGKYRLPSPDLLNPPDSTTNPLDRALVQETAAKIEETLRHFKIDARVVEVQRGPVITQYEVSLAAGIKVHKIVSLADDLAMALKAESIRIVAPIPGKNTVGVEVPNKVRVTVGLRELLESRELKERKDRLPLALGKDIAGNPIISDLGEMPHLLIAGSTGSGKSVCINSIIVNLLMTKTPHEVKLILIDPKMVELAPFEDIPHLLTPVVTDMKKAPAVLNWLVEKMEERYELLAMAGVRHLMSYNTLERETLRSRLAERIGEENVDGVPEFLPYYVVIIDELADLMMSASKEVETSITRLSQKSRAVGIHVILATQRPSVDVITGLIKANMPSRISFQVASKVDSRTILDRNGSEKLLGKGDLLYLPPGTSNLIRSQGTFISDKEIHRVVESVRREAEPQFDEELTRFGLEGACDGSQEDELYDQAVRIVLESQRGSVTLLQRQLQIGYTRASRLMELMAANGMVGPFKGSKAREVYYTLDEWEAARNAKPS
jgi:hypothetical protein